MDPKKVSDSSKVKRKTVRTMELKKEIIAKYDRGVYRSDLTTE